MLEQIDMTRKMSKEEFKKRMLSLEPELARLQRECKAQKLPVMIVFEGFGAAGKGYQIGKLIHAMDPRGFYVRSVGRESEEQRRHPFLWRYWINTPAKGEIAIFDRSWYGRVMVERLEGFCSEAEWQRAYDEINEFERELTDAGTVVVKFWVQIDKDTQLARFRERQNTPEKQWKITEEDWRNREKWDAYEEAVDEMLARTSTERAPWHILESVDKRYARIKAMRLVIGAIRQTLDR